jgi:predicted ester cyclase
VTTDGQQENIDLYQRFLAAFNAGDNDDIARVVAPGFTDHHPGFDIDGRPAYLTALRDMQQALQVSGTLDEVLPVGDDRVLTRLHLNGKHVGTVLDVPATGQAVEWSTTEIWRVADGLLIERWAQDDRLGLRNQLTGDDANVGLVRRVSDAVNDHRYDDLDPLFAPHFVDHNPAWSVDDLQALKGIIRAAHEALDFHAGLDALYAAAGGRVVMQVTFTGRHVGPFFGIQPTGKDVTWTSTEVYRIENHRVAERWVQADTTGLMRQIGVPLP